MFLQAFLSIFVRTKKHVESFKKLLPSIFQCAIIGISFLKRNTRPPQADKGGYMDKSKFLLVNAEVLPDVFSKVIEAKELLKSGKFQSVKEVTSVVGISRSTYYKYCDSVFRVSNDTIGQTVTLSMLLTHESGILSHILSQVADLNGNVLTISQNPPQNGVAKVTLTIDISDLNVYFSDLMDTLGNVKGVEKLNLESID